jgi:hypothetical protein
MGVTVLLMKTQSKDFINMRDQIVTKSCLTEIIDVGKIALLLSWNLKFVAYQ